MIGFRTYLLVQGFSPKVIFVIQMYFSYIIYVNALKVTVKTQDVFQYGYCAYLQQIRTKLL